MKRHHQRYVEIESTGTEVEMLEQIIVWSASGCAAFVTAKRGADNNITVNTCVIDLADKGNLKAELQMACSRQSKFIGVPSHD